MRTSHNHNDATLLCIADHTDIIMCVYVRTYAWPSVMYRQFYQIFHSRAIWTFDGVPCLYFATHINMDTHTHRLRRKQKSQKRRTKKEIDKTKSIYEANIRIEQIQNGRPYSMLMTNSYAIYTAPIKWKNCLSRIFFSLPIARFSIMTWVLTWSQISAPS